MKLIVVSNRLPITIIQENNALKYKESAGGLISGLSAYLSTLKDTFFTKEDCLWLGWPGSTIGDVLKSEARVTTQKKFHARPVFLSEEDMDKFYLGFCNKTIWPLFHYFPSYAIYDEEYWAQYQKVNQVFCEEVVDIAETDDLIWIHDYHLMLLPKMIRNKMPKASIGFFLHIPFPSFEIYRLLPDNWRRGILEGLLGADFIGFHTPEYTQYFLRCILRILGYENNLGYINLTDRITKAETFPMGIDYNKFNAASNTKEVKAEKSQLRKTLAGHKIILSINRLDYTKGILHLLKGFEQFLEKNPAWHGKIIMMLILVPSRIGVDQYQQMKKQIDEYISVINGRFTRIDWTPILYQHKFLSFNALSALYGAGDVCLVTPLRDGMNLIAKEYVAARADKTGVLILSEMAGAAKEMGEALIINPNQIEELAAALKQALDMPNDEQIRRNQIMQKRLARYDVARWASDFIGGLQTLKKDQEERFHAKYLSPDIWNRLVVDFRESIKRIVFLDYDGTLVPFVNDPKHANPTEEVKSTLIALLKVPNTEIAIISGRDHHTLDEWFGSLGVNLAAEHGAWLKPRGGRWQMIKPLIADWKPKIIPILELYADRLPGSFVEEKDYSVAWHYRQADPELSSIKAKELMDELLNLTSNMDIQILQSNKVVEVLNAGINKGVAGKYFLDKGSYDFILAIGDDWTDEDLFRTLPVEAYTLRLGMVASYARFNLFERKEIFALLKNLVGITGNI